MLNNKGLDKFFKMIMLNTIFLINSPYFLIPFIILQ
jgi:hypothetical protein